MLTLSGRLGVGIEASAHRYNDDIEDVRNEKASRGELCGYVKDIGVVALPAFDRKKPYNKKALLIEGLVNMGFTREAAVAKIS